MNYCNLKKIFTQIFVERETSSQLYMFFVEDDLSAIFEMFTLLNLLVDNLVVDLVHRERQRIENIFRLLTFFKCVNLTFLHHNKVNSIN